MSRTYYEVTATMSDPSATDAWLAWMLGEHIADVVRAGAESGRVIRRDEPPHTFIAQYEFASRAALDAYLAHHAPRLRAEGVRRFGDRVSYRRRVGQTVNRVT